MGFFLFLVIVGCIIWAVVAAAQSKAKALADARAAYLQSLSRLKHSPANPDLRQQTCHFYGYSPSRSQTSIINECGATVGA